MVFSHPWIVMSIARSLSPGMRLKGAQSSFKTFKHKLAILCPNTLAPPKISHCRMLNLGILVSFFGAKCRRYLVAPHQT